MQVRHSRCKSSSKLEVALSGGRNDMPMLWSVEYLRASWGRAVVHFGLCGWLYDGAFTLKLEEVESMLATASPLGALSKGQTGARCNRGRDMIKSRDQVKSSGMFH